MSPEEKAGVLMCRAAEAVVEALGMFSLNQHRLSRGETIAYDDDAFQKVIAEKGISWNDVHTVLFER